MGRSSGGLAVLWRKMTNIKCFPKIFTNRIMGLKIEIGPARYLVINIYLICDYRNVESLVEYKSILAELGNVLASEDFDNVIIAGDWNADPNKGRFFNEYISFLRENSLFSSDTEMLPADSYSYISNNESAGTSWLDHILCSSPSIINNCAILYGYTFEDHIPINCEIRSPILPECTQLSEGDRSFVQSSFGEILDELVGRFTNFGEFLAMAVFATMWSIETILKPHISLFFTV